MHAPSPITPQVDSDEEEAARLEEEEAVRLQREAAVALQPEDFSDDEEEDDEATLGEAVFEGRKGKDKVRGCLCESGD